MCVVSHVAGFYAGWTLVLLGFVAGAILGLGFAREEYLGGYSSFPRRLIRLGHIALVALGFFNVLVSIAVPHTNPGIAASTLFILGGVTMPAVCFLTAWRARFRHLFPIPVIALISAVILILLGGFP